MNLWNLGASLGIGGLIAVGFYKIAMVLIKVWSAADAARTVAFKESNAQLVTALGAGFASMHDSFGQIVQQHFEMKAELVKAITDSHAQTASDLADLARQVNSLDIHVSNANGFTPPPQMIPVAPTPRAATTYHDDEATPVDRPPVASRVPTPTQRAKSQPIVSGEYMVQQPSGPVKRPK